MALTPQARAERKLVDQFLAGDGAQASGFLGTLNQDINANKQARRAQQMGARGQATLGRGLDKMRSIPRQYQFSPSVEAWAGASPVQPTMNPSGLGGRAAMQQGMGAVPPVGGGPLALPPGSPGNLPVPSQGGVPSNIPGSPPQVGQVSTARGALPPGAMPQASRGVGGALGSAARTGAQTAASQADEFTRIAGEAAMQGSDDAARAAAKNAGKKIVAAGDDVVTKSLAQQMGVNITRGGLMKGGGIAVGGVMASNFIDGLNLGGEQSFLDRGGSAAILGGSLGAGGAVALGIPHVAAAAAGGALLLGAGRAIFGGKETKLETAQNTVADTRETIASLGTMYGIEGEAMQDIMLQYEASTSMYIQNKDTAGLKDFIAGLSTQLPALMLSARDEMKAGAQEQERYQTMMAAQAQFAPIFERTLDRASQASQTAYQTSNGAANYLDQRQPQLAALYRQTAAQSQASAANLHAAYAKQMASAPVTTGTTDQLQRQLAQEELMNQQLQMAGQF